MQAHALQIKEKEHHDESAETRITLPRFLLDLQSMVFCGAGAAGLCEVGLIEYLRRMGFNFEQLLRTVGVSVGGPGAFALATDMPPEKILPRLSQLNFKKLLDRGSLHRSAWRFFWEKKVCAGKEIQSELCQFVAEQIQRLNNRKNPIALPDDPRLVTFRHLRRLGCKELYIITAALYKYKGKQPHAEKRVWSHLTTPDAPVFWVMIASMALPGLFEGVTFVCDENNHYHVVSNTSTDPRAVTHIDGGPVDNSPLELFDNEFWLNNMSQYVMDLDEDGCANGCDVIAYFEKPVGILKTKALKNPHTLAIAVNPEVSEEEKIPFRSHELIPMAQACINGMMISGKLDYHIRHEADGDRLITINSPITTIQFDANEELQHLALLEGANAIAKKFNLPAPDPKDYVLPKIQSEQGVNENFSPVLNAAESFLMWGNSAFMFSPNSYPAEKKEDSVPTLTMRKE